MSCPICHRTSCFKSFHSLEAQEFFDKKQEMSDDVDTLRERVLELESTVKSLEERINDLILESAGEDL